MQGLLLRVFAFAILTSASAAVYAIPYLTITDAPQDVAVASLAP
jgi:hypothetical protein